MSATMNAAAIDLIVVVVLLANAAAGFRRGLALTVLEAVGFIAGGAVALVFLPDRLAAALPMTAPGLRLLLLVACCLLVALLGQAVVVRLGSALVRALRSSSIGSLDALLGSVLTVAVAAVTLWFAAGVVRVAAPGPFSQALAGSRVLGAVDSALPESTSSLIGRAVRAVDASGLPRAFAGLAQESVAPVAPADEGSSRTFGVRAAGVSVLRIDTQAPMCGRSQEGSGWAAGRGLVVTNAHVVSGGSKVTVTERGRHRVARVVAFDPQRDLAVLAVDGLQATPLRLGRDLGPGDPAVVAGYPLGGPFRMEPARVRQRLTARGEDIYGINRVTRQVYALRVQVYPGNSGGPLLTEDGRVSGVVFARSLDDGDTGYAVTLDELRPVLGGVGPGSPAVSTGDCAAG